MRWKSLKRDDEALNEVIGFILMFAVSSIVLVTSTQVFLDARENTDHMVGNVELKSLANRFSSQTVHAGAVAQDLPNATFETQVRVRPQVNGEPYSVNLTSTHVIAALENGDLEQKVTTYNLDALDVDVSGRAWGDPGLVTLTYEATIPATENGPLFDQHEKTIVVKNPR